MIDDYIPVFSGTLRPVFTKPKNHEAWVMLLEKAWAKLKGNYGATSVGFPHEVLNTFSLGPCVYYDFSNKRELTQFETDKIWNALLET